jgi:transcriptional regulator with XRE-family HTH domain
MSFQTDFGDALRAARKRAGWSQTELAQRSGVHLNTVSQVERGSADPRLSTLQALGNTLGLSLHVQVLGFVVSVEAQPEQALPNGMPAFLSKASE